MVSKTDTISTDVITNDSVSISASKALNRKFLRTAEIKFQTKDVRKAIYKIEDLVGHYGGYLEHNQLHSDFITENTIEISEDSVMKVGKLSAEAELLIRVPNQNLDSLLRKINPLIEYLEKRTIHAEDVRVQMLANQLKAKRLSENKNRFEKSVDSRNGNASMGLEAESEVLNKQMTADEYMLNNMSLADKVNFSTVNMTIYQATALYKEMAENPSRNFEPNLLQRLWSSLKTGWRFISNLLVVLTKGWSIIAIILAGMWVYRKDLLKKMGRG